MPRAPSFAHFAKGGAPKSPRAFHSPVRENARITLGERPPQSRRPGGSARHETGCDPIPGIEHSTGDRTDKNNAQKHLFSMSYARSRPQLNLFRKYPVQLTATLRLNAQPCEQPF